MRPIFTKQQQAWFKTNCFRVLKTKAKRGAGDGMHEHVFSIERKIYGSKTCPWVLRLSRKNGKVTNGKSIDLAPGARPQTLARAVDRIDAQAKAV